MKYMYMRGFDDKLIEHMGKGHSFETFPATIRYPPAIVKEWLNTKTSFVEAKRIGEINRIKTLESLLLNKMINLETFRFLSETEDSEIDNAISNFDENILIQAKERFAK